MSKTVTIGGDRIGSGNKMTAELEGYGSSHHKPYKEFQSSMTVGTLVPFYCQFMSNGDHANIDLKSLVRTAPSVGAMFGTYKLQIDMYKIPFRFYNKLLHNNTKNIGLDMSKVFLPQIKVRGRKFAPAQNDPNGQQIAPTSLINYLGVSGLGRAANMNYTTAYIERKFNAIPILAYYDIYANYYANLSEKIGVVCAPGNLIGGSIDTVWIAGVGNVTAQALTPALWTQNVSGNHILITGNGLTLTNISLTLNGTSKTLQQHISDGQLLTASITTDGKTAQIWITRVIPPVSLNGTGTLAAINVNQNEKTVFNPAPELMKFPIENIDKMRQEILAAANTSAKMIDATNAYLPYSTITNYQTYQTGGGTTTFLDSWQKAKFCGLAIKCYQSDRFNNWVNKEFVDKVNTSAEINLDDTGNILTMDTLNIQQKMFNYLCKVALSGGSYGDWLQAVYGRKGWDALEIPEWMGGMSSEIIFDEVVSTAGADAAGNNEPLGTLAGRGKEVNINKNHISIHADEPCLIMGIVSITPRLTYSQGNKWWTSFETMDDFHKPELDGIGFQELLTEEFAAFDTIVDQQDDMKVYYNSIGKQLAWTEYTTDEPAAHGTFAHGQSQAYMVLGRDYEHNKTSGKLEDATTYINPSKFNKNFAVTDNTAENFWVQIGVDVSMARVMSSRQIPNL